MIAITVRLPDELHETIRRMAEQDHRSVNGQIVWLLEHVLTPEGDQK